MSEEKKLSEYKQPPQTQYMNNLVFEKDADLESQSYPETKKRINPATGMPYRWDAKELQTLREVIMGCVTVEQLKGIIEVQVQKALQGHDFSAKFIFSFYEEPKKPQVSITKTTNIQNIVDLSKFTKEQLKQLQEMRKQVESKSTPNALESNNDETD